MDREFDVIVFGASGFTGQFVVEEMAISMEMDSLYKRNYIKWAVAGRNKDKIACILEEAAKNTGIEWCSKVPIIEADTEDYDSLLSMCRRARLIISTVGPYRFLGEPLVKACVEAASDYVDISGEPEFLERMQLEYFEEAKRKGVYIVSASGWDSVPADMGTTWTKQQFGGDLHSVEIVVASKAPDGAKMNFGTWHSAIYGLGNQAELKPLRQRLYSEILHMPKSKSKFPVRQRKLLEYIEEVKGYCLPFPGSDRTVVKRSEILKYNRKGERPVYCETYFRINSMFAGIMTILAASLFSGMVRFSFGRTLCKKFPGFFSFGVVSKDGVPRETLKKQSFSHTIIGYGWDKKISDADQEHDTPPTKKIITRISGPDPGYIATSTLLVHCGMTLLFDREKLPEPGVITPGACFRDTYLVDRLAKRNIKFEVLERF